MVILLLFALKVPNLLIVVGIITLTFVSQDCRGCNILINLYCYNMSDAVVEFILKLYFRLQAYRSSPTLHSLFRDLLDHSFISVMFPNVSYCSFVCFQLILWAKKICLNATLFLKRIHKL